MNATKPIFAYTSSIAPESLEKIEAAGYIPVQVESMESIRIIDPVPMASLDPVSRAAMDAIAASGSGSGVPDAFGRRVALALGSKRDNP